MLWDQSSRLCCKDPLSVCKGFEEKTEICLQACQSPSLAPVCLFLLFLSLSSFLLTSSLLSPISCSLSLPRPSVLSGSTGCQGSLVPAVEGAQLNLISHQPRIKLGLPFSSLPDHSVCYEDRLCWPHYLTSVQADPTLSGNSVSSPPLEEASESSPHLRYSAWMLVFCCLFCGASTHLTDCWYLCLPVSPH